MRKRKNRMCDQMEDEVEYEQKMPKDDDTERSYNDWKIKTKNVNDNQHSNFNTLFLNCLSDRRSESIKFDA